MERSKSAFDSTEDQYWYAQIVGSQHAQKGYNFKKWELVTSFNGKTESATPLKRLVNESRLQSYERQRALLFFNILLEKKIDFESDEELMRGYFMVARYLGCRVREVSTWKPKSHNRFRIFSELIRYIFAKYPMPAFMDSAFMDKNPIYAQWFIHLAQGRSVRTLPKCPIQMTAKMAHWFIQTPPQYSVSEALRYAQVMNMGGNERLVRAILATRLGQSFEHDDFWQTVIRFFIQNPMLELGHIQPIVDYIQNVKYESRIEVNPLNINGRMVVPPEQPNFSIKGRTATSLLRVVDDWHRALRLTTSIRGYKEALFWQPVPIHNFKYREGANDANYRVYEIYQLVSSPALLQEGRTLHHCVYSYTTACMQGRTSIWSMFVRDEYEIKTNLLTIEVSSHNKTIVQVRGKCNRFATESEMKIINRWAIKEDLAIAKWVFA